MLQQLWSKTFIVHDNPTLSLEINVPKTKTKKQKNRSPACSEVEVLHAGLLERLVEVRNAADDANGSEHRERCGHQPISDAGHHVAAAGGHLKHGRQGGKTRNVEGMAYRFFISGKLQLA